MARIRKNGDVAFPHVFFGEAPAVAATINTGDLTVSTTPPASGTLTIETYEVTTGFSIAAGAYMVTIKNVGGGIEGGAFENITVNGDTVAPGEQVTFESELDPTLGANGTYLTLPAITVVNGSSAGVWYQVKS